VTIGCNTVTSTSSFTVASGQANQPPIILSSTTGVTVGGIVTIDLLPLISDADNNLDSSTLKLVTNESEQGASAIINASSHLILDYGGTEFYGTDMVMIEVCDLEASCTQQELTVQVTGDIVVYNGISPNGDALNATWQIGNIEVFEQTKKNRVTIFNRWGDEVFSTTDYNNADRVFKGITNSGNELPSGTYFYRIKFTSGLQTRTGYLVLKR
jgi:gliding motility-associated-like protein